MKKYVCEQCKMEIRPLVCNKCGETLEENIIEKDHKKIRVSKCPNSHGMVKSPLCCGHDMRLADDK